ncbi:aldo/keto reductase [Fodinibius saliphilus]|uniref:aldo/keto reductase n=1 Tax=Fodinibius saliphilus TaxID=1920650 RepID=UPI001107EA27|nr:aldo/keto reductase [Fodinibius saliphilus]
MQYKNIQGLEVPEIGLGTYKLHDRECSKIVRTALDLGYRHIDTAQMYKNEREIGEALNVSNVPREDIFLSTKIWHTNLDADDVLQSTEESLRQLDTPYVDLLMIHWPNDQYDLRPTIESMLVLRDQGKAMNIGVSNFPLDLLKIANDEIRAPIFCNQVEFHPFIDQLDLLDYAIEKDIMVTAYSPLAQGKVTENKEMQEIAEKYDKSPAQISLRWLIEQENVVAIPKASNEEHLKENFEVFDFFLEDEDFDRIDQLEKTTRLVNPSFAPNWG